MACYNLEWISLAIKEAIAALMWLDVRVCKNKNATSDLYSIISNPNEKVLGICPNIKSQVHKYPGPKLIWHILSQPASDK